MEKEIFKLFDNEIAKFFIEICEHDGIKVINFLIESNGFKGHGPYYLLTDSIQETVNQLKKMSKNFCGECSINDSESINNLRIFFRGRDLYVKGAVGDYGQHLLTFEFKSDQTILIPLANILERLYNKN